ncbi:MAG TPA: VWA domain-containing protein [Candidatus Limnocylindrales bacterium]|nr:VWA domain-containing protein [Candidatus Limnocylindrales bacterium]
MSFIWPAVLVLLLVIPLGVAVYVTRERRRRARVAEALGALQPAAVAGAGGGRAWRRRIPAALLVAGMTVLVLALARPQSVIGVPRFEGTVVLAFDVSGSMAATDMQPSRMEAAKTAARTFVSRQPDSILIGVVAFSDAGFSVTVPTDDQASVLAAIDRLGPERGTSIARGIVSSLTAIATSSRDPEAGYYTNRSPDPDPLPPIVAPGTFAPAAIVLLTDGENNQQPDPLTAAQGAAERGVRIFPVGLGTAAGTTLEVEGFRVHSQLDEPTLRQIAEITDGTYYAASEPDQLSGIYDDIEKRFVIRPEATEITSFMAGAGLGLLMLGGLASLLWLGRMP